MVGGPAAHNQDLEVTKLSCWSYEVEWYSEAKSHLLHVYHSFLDLIFAFSDHSSFHYSAFHL